MLDTQTFSLFLLTALVLVLSPGPDTVLILSRTLASGKKAGLLTLVGTQAGNLLHALLAGLGVSSIIMMFPLAFDLLKYCGVAYLLYLAASTWRASASIDLTAPPSRERASTSCFFIQGFTNNLVNPKMIPFFVALFPQFVCPEKGAVALQSVLLGATLASMAILWIGMLVFIVCHFRTEVTSSTKFLKLANRLAAITFFGLACRLAFQER